MATTQTPPGESPTTGGGPPDAPTGVGAVVERAKGAVRAADRWQRTHRAVAVGFAVVKKFGDDRAGNLAALVAYYTFFALFPLLLILVTILGYALAGNPDAQHRILDSALSNFPVVGDQLRSNIGSFRGSGIALVIGVVGALWGGMGALDAMQNAMNSVWNVPLRTRPNLVQSRLRGLVMLVVLAVVIAASTALGSAAAVADSLPVVGRFAAVPLSAGLNVALFLAAFKILTDVDVGWRPMVPGAVAAGMAFTVLQGVGGWYVERVLRGATQTYGTFAVVLGLLSWLYLLAQLTVFAAEVNVVRHRGLAPRSLSGEDLTEADRRALHHYARVEERLPQEEVTVDLRDRPGDDAGASTGDGAPAAADDRRLAVHPSSEAAAEGAAVVLDGPGRGPGRAL